MTQQFRSLSSTHDKWKLCLYKTFYTNVHSSIIHNSPKLEIIQMSISWWMDKQNVAYLYNGILFSNEKEWITDGLWLCGCYDIDEPEKITLSERSQTQKTIYGVGFCLHKMLKK